MPTIKHSKINKVNFDEINNNFYKYFKHIEQGKAFTIMKEGKPIAELLPLKHPKQEKRPFGLCAGEFKVPDDFNSPLPNNVIKDFEK